jgi:microcompartment protein CcmL/EutN
MNGQSLGMIETWGYVAAVEALDAGMKAANVFSQGVRVTPSALVTISFRGDVSAVQTAVSAGVAAARKVGKVVSYHVIARPEVPFQRESRESAEPAVKSVRSPKKKVDKMTASDSKQEAKETGSKQEAKETGVVSGLAPVRKATERPAAKTRTKKKAKTSLPAKKRKRPPGKTALSPKKTGAQRQKKKGQGAGKKSS